MSVLPELATEARRINAANGWGLDFDPEHKREIPGYLALIHSEISEAWCASDLSTALRELGDVIVRCLDLCELLTPGGLGQIAHEPDYVDPDTRWLNWSDQLVALHGMTSEALEIYRKATPFVPSLILKLLEIVERVWALMEALHPPCNPEKVVRGILEANSKRPYRHGGKRT